MVKHLQLLHAALARMKICAKLFKKNLPELNNYVLIRQRERKSNG